MIVGKASKGLHRPRRMVVHETAPAQTRVGSLGKPVEHGGQSRGGNDRVVVEHPRMTYAWLCYEPAEGRVVAARKPTIPAERDEHDTVVRKRARLELVQTLLGGGKQRQGLLHAGSREARNAGICRRRRL